MMHHRYCLTTALLSRSTNPYIQTLKQNNFYLTKNPKNIRWKGIPQLTEDCVLMKVNGICFGKAISRPPKDIFKKSLTEDVIKATFTQENTTHIFTHHSNTLQTLLGGYCLSLYDEAQTIPFVLKPSQQNKFLYEKNTKAFYKVATDEFSVFNFNSRSEIKLSKQSTEVICHITKKGYHFLANQTDSMALFDLIMGAIPTHIDWFIKRDRANWTWLEKNFRVFEPIFIDSYIEPLNHRINTLFHTIYNNNFHNKVGLIFLDWPQSHSSTFLKLTRYILAGRFLSPIKNILKLFAEFMPAIIECCGAYILDCNKQYFCQPENKKFLFQNIISGIGVGVGGLLYMLGKVSRELVMRVTSPIRSIREAYQFSIKNHGKLLGISLCILSTLISIGAFLAIGIVCIPMFSTIIKIAACGLIPSTIDRAWSPIKNRLQTKHTLATLKTVKERAKLLSRLHEPPVVDNSISINHNHLLTDTPHQKITQDENKALSLEDEIDNLLFDVQNRHQAYRFFTRTQTNSSPLNVTTQLKYGL